VSKHGGAAGSGAPKGERNGNYKHGRNSRRRQFSALLSQSPLFRSRFQSALTLVPAVPLPIIFRRYRWPDVMETTLRKLLTFLIALAAVAFGVSSPSLGQVGQIPTYLQPAPASGGAYTGPGDVVSGATAWWGKLGPIRSVIPITPDQSCRSRCRVRQTRHPSPTP
jgi:hypothetical protein